MQKELLRSGRDSLGKCVMYMYTYIYYDNKHKRQNVM